MSSYEEVSKALEDGIPLQWSRDGETWTYLEPKMAAQAMREMHPSSFRTQPENGSRT